MRRKVAAVERGERGREAHVRSRQSGRAPGEAGGLQQSGVNDVGGIAVCDAGQQAILSGGWRVQRPVAARGRYCWRTRRWKAASFLPATPSKSQRIAVGAGEDSSRLRMPARAQQWRSGCCSHSVTQGRGSQVPDALPGRVGSTARVERIEARGRRACRPSGEVHLHEVGIPAATGRIGGGGEIAATVVVASYGREGAAGTGETDRTVSAAPAVEIPKCPRAAIAKPYVLAALGLGVTTQLGADRQMPVAGGSQCG
jgi:hypothetical protein